MLRGSVREARASVPLFDSLPESANRLGSKITASHDWWLAAWFVSFDKE